MIINKMKYFFEYYADSNPRQPEITDECLHEMEEIAAEDPVEFQNLVDLFNELIFVYDKLDIADVLTNLKYEKVKDFLVKVINEEPNEVYKLCAVKNLLKFEDERAVRFLKDFIKIAKPVHIRAIANILSEVENKMSIKLLRKFYDEYQEIRKVILPAYFDDKIQEYE